MTRTTRTTGPCRSSRFRRSDMMTSMKFRHELSYDASPAEVFEMLADPAFREKVGEALDVVSADIALERDGDGFTLDQRPGPAHRGTAVLREEVRG